jgi:hypothetical protein
MASGTRITVRRPGGEIETVMQEGKYFTQVVKRKMTEATRAAGRGEILSFEEIAPEATLEEQRRDLVASIRGLIDESDAAFERAHAREDVMAWEIKRRHDARVDEARRALTDFDAAHPEIIAAIRAEQQERTERFLRQD